MKDRIVLIRKKAKVTQPKFGETLGVTAKSVQSWEYGYSMPSKAMQEKICQTFSINRTWLETGEGEMYLETDRAMIDRIVAEYNGSEVFRAILETYITMPEENRRAVEDFVGRLMDYKSGLQKEAATVTDLESPGGSAPSDSAQGG